MIADARQAHDDGRGERCADDAQMTQDDLVELDVGLGVADLLVALVAGQHLLQDDLLAAFLAAMTTMLSALVSIYTQRRIRHDVAMTGEITLRGLVLPVGGIKEKVLAAKRAGLDHVLLPDKNEKDVREIESDALEGVEVTYVRRMEQVIDHVLEEEAMNDPETFFAVPDREKHLHHVSEGANSNSSALEGTVVN